MYHPTPMWFDMIIGLATLLIILIAVRLLIHELLTCLQHIHNATPGGVLINRKKSEDTQKIKFGRMIISLEIVSVKNYPIRWVN